MKFSDFQKKMLEKEKEKKWRRMLLKWIAQRVVIQTFLGNGVIFSVAPSLLPTVSWTRDKAHFDIVLVR